MKILGVIPARLQSTRLPRKLLLAETGKPLIQYVWEAASKSRLLSEVLIATDSGEIADAVSQFGGECVMTGEHPSGTDRIAEAIRNHPAAADIIINIQGDEPEIDAAQIDLLAERLLQHSENEMATLATPIRSVDQLVDSSCTKVVCDLKGNAMYFSRSVIPGCRDCDVKDQFESMSAANESPWLLHVGLYGYRNEVLQQLASLPPSQLEQLESLEQLRALEHGFRIGVEIVEHPAVGIDTAEDYSAFVNRELKRERHAA